MRMDNRQRLRPWLEAQINSGKFRGLEWVDDAKTMFKIPWKHAGKKEWTPDDCKVFEEWARHTGKYREGVDEPDYATWKTRLRCAFNKAPDIKEISDRTNLSCNEPFRVYNLLPRKDKRLVGSLPPYDSPSRDFVDTPFSPSPSYEPGGNQEVPLVVEQHIDSGVEPMNISGRFPSDLNELTATELIAIEGNNMSVSEAIDSATNMLPDIGDTPTRLSDIGDTSNRQPEIGLKEPVGATIQCVDMTNNFFATILASPDNKEGIPVPAEALQADVMMSEGASFLPAIGNIVTVSPPLAEETDSALDITVFYCGNPVAEQRVFNEEGCRLYYEPSQQLSVLAPQLCRPEDSKKLVGSSELRQLCLPACECQTRFEDHTKALLKCMARGITLECERGDIYATRLCKCTIFHCSQSTDYKSMKLQRQDRVKVFDFTQYFRHKLSSYLPDEHCEPDPSVHFFCGQGGNPDNLDKVLIGIKVTSVRALFELQEHKNVQVPPSSRILGSDEYDNPLISTSDEYDQLAQRIQRLETSK